MKVLLLVPLLSREADKVHACTYIFLYLHTYRETKKNTDTHTYRHAYMYNYIGTGIQAVFSISA